MRPRKIIDSEIYDQRFYKVSNPLSVLASATKFIKYCNIDNHEQYRDTLSKVSLKLTEGIDIYQDIADLLNNCGEDDPELYIHYCALEYKFSHGRGKVTKSCTMFLSEYLELKEQTGYVYEDELFVPTNRIYQFDLSNLPEDIIDEIVRGLGMTATGLKNLGVYWDDTDFCFKFDGNNY